MHIDIKIAIQKIKDIVGSQACLTDKDATQPFLHEWRGRLEGKTAAVILPKTKEDISKIIKICSENKIAIVPQGGNTGLVGASVPTEARSICLSLKRINTIRVINPNNYSLIAEAGCILQTAKEQAAQQNRLLAMTLASEGSATIGGLIATNAGGSFTLRYGNMREQVLGIEAVLPNGEIFDGLKTVRKNNCGYDLKQLLIGSEGTLGVVTAAALRLLPIPTKKETALIAFLNPDMAIAAFSRLRELGNDSLAAFELLPQIAIEAAQKLTGTKNAFHTAYPWVALIETHQSVENKEKPLEKFLEILLAEELIVDAAPATSLQQSNAMWQLRETIVDAQKTLGASLKHDLAVPIHAIPALIQNGSAAVQKIILGAKPYLFGHVGDGNIHFNISQPENMDKNSFLDKREDVASALHDITLNLGGSISAEHGIGRFKRDEFLRTTPFGVIAMMQKIKQTLDPNSIMNPDILFPAK